MRFEDRYDRKQAIGQGPVTTTYEAWDMQLERKVAIHEVDEAHAGDSDFVEQLRREVRLVAEISHPHVLAIYDIHEDRGLRLVTEFADGGSLRDLCSSPTQPQQAAEALRQLLRGLGELHRRGVIHRNVKPGSLFLSRDRYKVGEFSLVASAEQTLVFTDPKYLAPEIPKGEGRPGPASDVYALGLVIYELVLGEEGFVQVVRKELEDKGQPTSQGPDDLWYRFQAATFDLPPLHEVDSRVPESLSRVVEKMMRRDPGRRYTDTDEVLRDLDGDGPRPEGPGVTQSLEPRRKRPWLLWGAVAGLVLVSMLAAAIFIARGRYVEFDLTSSPPGATVLFAGEEVGSTPYSSRAEPGTRLSVAMDGFQSREIEIGEEGGDLTVELSWEPVELDTSPSGAAVYLEGEELGRTPLDVALDGRREAALDVLLEGAEPRQVVLHPGQEPVHLQLSPSPFDGSRIRDGDDWAAEVERLVARDPSLQIQVHAGPPGTSLDPVSRLRAGEVFHFRIASERAGYLSLFILDSEGDLTLLYPSPDGTPLSVEPSSEILVPPSLERPEGRFVLRATPPLGDDRVYALRTREQPLVPARGEKLGTHATIYSLRPEQSDDPARTFARDLLQRLAEEDGASLNWRRYSVQGSAP